MRILITGAAGMLGRDVTAAARGAGHATVALARRDLDIADAGAVKRTVTEAAPQLVINCAAWTDVDGAEAAYPAALEVNGTGAGNVARSAAAAGAWTVHVSSDYVFDGAARAPYVESDPVAPQGAYGRSKRQGELEVARAAPAAHTIVRSSWLFGAGGPCFPKTILRLAGERDRVKVVDDQIGCPTFTGHLAPALVGLADQQATGPPLGLLHVAAAGQCSWFAFAREIVAGAGLDCPVDPVGTDEFPRSAPRPAYSVLRSERGALAPQLPDWREGLTRFFALRATAGLV